MYFFSPALPPASAADGAAPNPHVVCYPDVAQAMGGELEPKAAWRSPMATTASDPLGSCSSMW
jgi:hypothetical protein